MRFACAFRARFTTSATAGSTLVPIVHALAREPHVVVIAPPATYVEQWCDYFRSIGWKVDWISYAFEEDGAIAHVPELGGGRPWRELWELVREGRRLRRLLDGIDPDLVQAHWFTGPGWLMAIARRRPFMVTVWGSDVLRFAGTTRLRRM